MVLREEVSSVITGVIVTVLTAEALHFQVEKRRSSWITIPVFL